MAGLAPSRSRPGRRFSTSQPRPSSDGNTRRRHMQATTLKMLAASALAVAVAAAAGIIAIL
jgi:hypothetical protein